MHEISAQPLVPAFSQAAIGRFKGSMPFFAITFFDMRTFALLPMSAFSAMALACGDRHSHGVL